MAKQWPYRCQNPLCAGKPDFWVDTDKVAACPCCEISITDKRFGKVISPLVVMHFEPPSHVAGYGRGHYACDPGKVVVQVATRGRELATGEPRAVTCPSCKETAAYAAAIGDENAVAKLDFHAIKAAFGTGG